MTKRHNQDDVAAPRSHGRRQFIFGAAAAGVGLAAGLIGGADPADAADGDSLKLALGNTATATTTLTASSGSALRGRATANGNIGIEGNDASPAGNGYGVFGDSANGYGVYGVSGGGTGVYGTSGDGIGVYGNAAGGNGVRAHSDAGYGVYATGGFTGVYADCDGTDGNGVLAYARGVAGTGVYGSSDGASGHCAGVYGTNVTDPSGYGVYAIASKGTAFYAVGNAGVSGTFSKAGGSFQIDHPLDPAHKYLYHSFVESPDMKNVYDGAVTLDSRGQATVELPDWFETLNRDYRYQLTAIGAAAPGLHIASEVADGKFGIAGGRPGLKVSWQVTGIRQDAWANAHRIPVEADKPAVDQGRYLHPELYENGHGEPIEALTVGWRHVERTQPEARA